MAGFVAALAPAPVCAEGWGGSLSIASDKVVRGVSQSEGRPALLLDLHRRSDTGWTAALGLAGPAYSAQGGKVELTLAVAHAWQPAVDWTLQFALANDRYLGSRQARGYSYTEGSVSADWQGRLRLSIALSPDTSGMSAAGGWRSGRATALELNLHERLAGRLALDAGLGYQDLRAAREAGYAYGSAGLSWGLGPVQAYLTRIVSQAGERGLVPPADAGGRWVAALLWSF